MRRISEVLRGATSGQRVNVQGWVRTARLQKRAGFVQLGDGSCVDGVQVVIDPKLVPEGTKTGASMRITGVLENHPVKQGEFEVRAEHAEIIGTAEDFPLAKKYHSLEYLRTIPHLRPRTNMFGAVLRVRNNAAMALHEFFQDKGIMHLHAPILTGADCEGAGEQFVASPGKKGDSLFFGNQDSAYLTVSAQLHAEIFAAATP
jgi:asparaginyl-tRNA synthetase